MFFRNLCILKNCAKLEEFLEIATQSITSFSSNDLKIRLNYSIIKMLKVFMSLLEYQICIVNNLMTKPHQFDRFTIQFPYSQYLRHHNNTINVAEKNPFVSSV